MGRPGDRAVLGGDERAALQRLTHEMDRGGRVEAVAQRGERDPGRGQVLLRLGMGRHRDEGEAGFAPMWLV
ncbi:hypothetical protein GCM10027612_25420 [Microbispora bryophytorum subsp. camponoti]